MRSKGSKSKVGLGVCAAAAVTFLLLTPSPATAAAAQISGKVVNGTTAEPVPDQPVRIVLFDNTGEMGVGRATTDAAGAFSYTPPAAATGYQVLTEYKDATYAGEPTQLVLGQPSKARLTVFEPSNDAESIVQTDWIVWIDIEGDGIAVQQDFAFMNTGNTAYVGPGDGEPVLSIPLDPDASNLQFLGAFLNVEGKRAQTAYLSPAPIVPGRSEATLRYTLPGTRVLSFPAAFPVQSFQMFVPTSFEVQSPQMRLAGQTTDRGITYSVYSATDIPKNGSIDVVLTPAAGGSTERAATTYLLIGAAVLALAAIAAFALLRRREGGRSSRGGRSPRVAKGRSSRTDGQGAKPREKRTADDRIERVAIRVERDTDDVELLIDEIAALDLSYEKGLLEDKAYRRLRVAAKDRLLRARTEAERGAGV